MEFLNAFIDKLYTTPLLAVTIAFSILFLILLIITIRLHLRLSKLLKGKSAESLEDTLVHTSKEVADLQEFQKQSEAYLTTVERRLRTAVQSVETVRFNPFKGTGAGGNQSFATAFVNQNGDGLIVSTLYASDRMSVFAKPVVKFTATFDLTEEEKTVLMQATKKFEKM